MDRLQSVGGGKQLEPVRLSPLGLGSARMRLQNLENLPNTSPARTRRMPQTESHGFFCARGRRRHRVPRAPAPCNVGDAPPIAPSHNAPLRHRGKTCKIDNAQLLRARVRKMFLHATTKTERTLRAEHRARARVQTRLVRRKRSRESGRSFRERTHNQSAERARMRNSAESCKRTLRRRRLARRRNYDVCRNKTDGNEQARMERHFPGGKNNLDSARAFKNRRASPRLDPATARKRSRKMQFSKTQRENHSGKLATKMAKNPQRIFRAHENRLADRRSETHFRIVFRRAIPKFFPPANRNGAFKRATFAHALSKHGGNKSAKCTRFLEYSPEKCWAKRWGRRVSRRVRKRKKVSA